MCWPACVCRPCGHTAGFENYEVKVGRCMNLKRESVCGQGGVGWAWGGGQFKWLLAPQVSHPGVLQRWEGSSRGSSLVLVLSVLLLCNWLAGVSSPLGRFLLGQEPEGWKDAKLLNVGPGPYLLAVDYTDYMFTTQTAAMQFFQQILFFFF